MEMQFVRLEPYALINPTARIAVSVKIIFVERRISAGHRQRIVSRVRNINVFRIHQVIQNFERWRILPDIRHRANRGDQ